MTTTILTDDQIISIMAQHINHDNDDMRVKPMSFARAIEQTVLQSPEVQALKRDAERYRKVRRMTLRQYSDLYQANIKTGAPFDRLVDAAMEKKP